MSLRKLRLDLFECVDRVDMVMNTVEAVAEVVETVAHKVEDVADGIADSLPEDGKLKAAFEAVEAIAKETARDAHMVDQLIEKVSFRKLINLYRIELGYYLSCNLSND